MSGTTPVINIDTHILLAAIDRKLRPDEQRLLDGVGWCISDIVIWEIGKLKAGGRITMTLDHPGLNRALREMTIWPITREIAEAAGRLDFRSDPADQIIAATSIAHDVPLLTRDTRILSSKVVPLALA
jgi:PIN domain nuclease of toxin-antitoxin system